MPITLDQTLKQIQEASDYLKTQIPNHSSLYACIVCGSGLGGLADTLDEVTVINYSDIPHFPTTTVTGHAGKLVSGVIEGKPVLCMVGRFHYYEGHPLSHVVFPIRVMATLGIRILIATNAAGGLNPEYNVGDVMVIEDHVSLANLSGLHPLVGPNLETFGARFISTSDAYDLELRRAAFQAATLLTANNGQLTIHEGIYANVSGPTYETRAECRLLRLAGADAVGMSTVPEVVTAKHCGMRILAMSLITNKVVMARQPPSYAPPPASHPEEVHASHEEVLAASASKALLMQDLIKGIFSLLR